MISKGIHHITAFCSDAQKNVDFYTKTLGLELVKVTVNFDDPHSYHLYYGLRGGEPGTVLTFFVWPHSKRSLRGSGVVSEIWFDVPRGSSWPGERTEDGFVVYDPDGLKIRLIESNVKNTDGFRGATLSVRSPEKTIQLLENSFGYKRVSANLLKSIGDGFLEVLKSGLPLERAGAGSIHHIALRAKNESEQAEIQDHLPGVTPIINRMYFKSIYFRESQGVLFEVATDEPGFGIDEETLGSKLCLPPQHEHLREELYQSLPRFVAKERIFPSHST